MFTHFWHFAYSGVTCYVFAAQVGLPTLGYLSTLCAVITVFLHNIFIVNHHFPQNEMDNYINLVIFLHPSH